MTKKIPTAFQFKILLQSSKPPIWRRVIVPSHFTFHDLHLIIQSAFEWTNYHLYAFEILTPAMGSGSYESIVDLSVEENEGLGTIDSRTQKIDQYFGKVSDSINYIYDFGDNWNHKVVLEKTIENYTFSSPQCVKAVRCAPCEDSGAMRGWEEKMEMMRNYDSKNEEHCEIFEWLSEIMPAMTDVENPRDFDREKVEIDKINERVKDYKFLERRR